MARSRLRKVVDLFRRTPLHPQWLLGVGRRLEGELRGLPAGRVLDIGCADRWVERHLPAGSHYLGLDYPATGLDWYAARPDLLADAAALPVAGSSLDAVVMLEVLEHLERPREALVEIARVLRPRGRLLLSMPFLYPIHDAPQDFQRYTCHGLLRELAAAGLVVDRLDPGLGSAESAGLLLNLALGGMAQEALRRRHPGVLLLPAIALLVPLVNGVAWLLGRILPGWPALTAGYVLSAHKP